MFDTLALADRLEMRRDRAPSQHHHQPGLAKQIDPTIEVRLRQGDGGNNGHDNQAEIWIGRRQRRPPQADTDNAENIIRRADKGVEDLQISNNVHGIAIIASLQIPCSVPLYGRIAQCWSSLMTASSPISVIFDVVRPEGLEPPAP